MPPDRREWPPGTVHVRWHPCVDLKPGRLKPRFRAKIFGRAFQRWVGPPRRDEADRQPKARISGGTAALLATRGSAFASLRRAKGERVDLKDADSIADAHQIFHARSVPVRQAIAAMTGGAANCLGIVCAMNPNARFV